MKYRSKPTEVEAMQWHTGDDMACTDFTPLGCAQTIVAWVNDNGGEARYEPSKPYPADISEPWGIAVRTKDGMEFAAPGHYVVMGSA